MALRTWLITGVSSGFGRELTQQLLGRGDRVVGTVRHTSKVTDVSRPATRRRSAPRCSTSRARVVARRGGCGLPG